VYARVYWTDAADAGRGKNNVDGHDRLVWSVSKKWTKEMNIVVESSQPSERYVSHGESEDSFKTRIERHVLSQRDDTLNCCISWSLRPHRVEVHGGECYYNVLCNSRKVYASIKCRGHHHSLVKTHLATTSRHQTPALTCPT
jgi:hypothetical protein